MCLCWTIGRFSDMTALDSKHRRYLSAHFVVRNKRHDKLFSGLVVGAAVYTLLMVGLVAFSVAKGSVDIFSYEGVQFFSTPTPRDGRAPT